MQDSLEEFTKRGVKIVAVSVDPPATTRAHAEKQGYAFTFLSDEKMEVIRRFDFVHEGASFAVQGGDISRPAEFLLDSSGVIRWRNLSPTYRERLKAEEALKVIDKIKSAGQ